MNKKSNFRLARNILVALFSAGWLIPAIVFLEIFLKGLTFPNKPLPPEFSYIHEVEKDGFLLLCSDSFITTAIWLALVIIFWTFVAANRIWPIKGNRSEQKKSLH